MNELIFQKPKMFYWLILLIVFVLLYVLRQQSKNKDLRAFSGESFSSNRVHISLEIPRFMLLCLALIMVVVALSRPAYNPHKKMLKREGRDIAFVLDVSNSMLAEDLIPNRLERAKMAIAECVESFENHRVALILFAGTSSIQCPLTNDYDFFLARLENASPDSASQGGTRIDEALLKTCDKLFNSSDYGFRDILLITDGGNQGNNLPAAIELINKNELRLICLGFGDETTGARIPTPNEKSDYMMYKEQEVWTKLESPALRQLTKDCDAGIYLPVGTKSLNLKKVYKQLSAGQKHRSFGEQSVTVYEQIFHYFIAAALILLLLMILLPRSLTRRAPSSATAILFLLLSLPAMSSAANKTEADKSFLAGDYKQAALTYQLVHEKRPTSRSGYDLGNAHYHLKNFEEAVAAYSFSLEKSGSFELRLKCTYNLANSLVELAKKAEDPELSLENLQQARLLYRQVLRYSPQHQKAAINMEISLRMIIETKKEIKRQEQEQQELQLAFDHLRQILTKLILQQQQNLNNTNLLLKDPKALEAAQLLTQEQEIVTKTQHTQQLLKVLFDKSFADLPAEANPLEPCLLSLSQAELAEKNALLQLPIKLDDASKEQTDAVKHLQQALKLLPEKADQKKKQQDQKSSDEEGEEGEEGEEEGEEGEEGEEQGEAGENKIALDNQLPPPPKDSPANIIKQEANNQKSRQGKNSGKKQQVEKNW